MVSHLKHVHLARLCNLAISSMHWSNEVPGNCETGLWELLRGKQVQLGWKQQKWWSYARTCRKYVYSHMACDTTGIEHSEWSRSWMSWVHVLQVGFPPPSHHEQSHALLSLQVLEVDMTYVFRFQWLQTLHLYDSSFWGHHLANKGEEHHSVEYKDVGYGSSHPNAQSGHQHKVCHHVWFQPKRCHNDGLFAKHRVPVKPRWWLTGRNQNNKARLDWINPICCAAKALGDGRSKCRGVLLRFQCQRCHGVGSWLDALRLFST